MVELLTAESGTDIADVRALFLEYGTSLNFSLCFQSFETELAQLPGAYAPPLGRLVLARVGGQSAGCIALRPIDSRTCEMKRLYVRPQFRGLRMGHGLVSRLIDDARAIGYQSMRLDTIGGAMDRAIALYREMGFREIPAYTPNPVPNVLYFELVLSS